MSECEIQDDPTLGTSRCNDLFRDTEAKFALSQISSDKWYLPVLSTLATTSKPYLADRLYKDLIDQPAYSTSSLRKPLLRRMREALFKDIVLLELPKPCEALIAISRAELEKDLDDLFSREGWQCDGANYERGMTWIQTLYAQNATALFSLFKSHRDFGFWISNIAYGLHLSDHQILDDVDTEMVVLRLVWVRTCRERLIGTLEVPGDWEFQKKMWRWSANACIR